MLNRIVSGGQTGADRGALDGALEMDTPIGGYCPKGRRAEDGTIPDRYPLVETESSQYPDRTKLNISESDGTVIFTFGQISTAGSHLTVKIANSIKKPWIHLDLDGFELTEAAQVVVDFCQKSNIQVLNVAGNRESVSPGIQDQVRQIIMLVINKLRKGI